MEIVESLPVWERGLKPAGSAYLRSSQWHVAPRVGAWIETYRIRKSHCGAKSLPVWERGLKPFILLSTFRCIRSLPVWERGLKRPHSFLLC